MKRLAVAVAGLVLVAGCSRESGQPPAPSPTPAQPSPVQVGDPVEGLRVATRVGCNGCHGKDGGGAVFREDGEGRFVAPNLTQRREIYDDRALDALLRQGKTHDGHAPISMPIKMFQHLSDQEIRNITAWLRSIPAVANPDLPEGAWSEAVKSQVRDGTYPYLDDTRPDRDNQPPTSPPVTPLELGKHLAMTSCSECHAWDLNGWPGDPAPSLIVAKAYTAQNFYRLMKTGITATGRESTTGLMTLVARERFHVLTDDEIAALKLYLDSRSGPEGAASGNLE